MPIVLILVLIAVPVTVCALGTYYIYRRLRNRPGKSPTPIVHRTQGIELGTVSNSVPNQLIPPSTHNIGPSRPTQIYGRCDLVELARTTRMGLEGPGGFEDHNLEDDNEKRESINWISARMEALDRLERRC
ncbi:hypothetical protein K504DRAFT_505916 [Pleomassaria siparia CBS 279.74]|uniref:Uncharacterized protein n=1 Tax=Pleomassaria siparia CBS 279.74 TaxID=1314801 RepID=A0A6G1JY83_9PLEO|nr:hypothetical protein K504DRAFT_505916 [Pleomassaria siparia CBS 279.74]